MSNKQSLMAARLVQANSLMLGVMGIGFLFSLYLASWYGMWNQGLIIGFILLILAAAVRLTLASSLLSGPLMAALQMAMVALQIHLAHGMIEIHFGVFVMLAILAVYRQIWTLISGAGTIAVHHFLFCYLQMSGYPVWLFRSMEDHWFVVSIHAAYVVVETGVLITVALQSRQEHIQGDLLTETSQAMTGTNGVINLDVKVPPLTAVLTRFNEFLTSLVGLGYSLRREKEALGVLNKDLLRQTESISDDSEVSSKVLHELASAIEQMSASANEVAGSAEQAQHFVSEAVDQQHQAKSATEVSANASIEMRQQIGETAELLGDVNQASNAISKVLDVIAEIADKTNLLALNAAIEAARAGDSGRGFAVVADEVRALAAQTQKSTGEIGDFINRLQRKVASAVGAMKTCEDRANSSAEAAEAVAERIAQSQNTLDLGSNHITQVAAATQQQHQVAREMAKSASEMRTRQQQILAAIQQLEELTLRINRQEQSMDKQLGMLYLPVAS
ncbi:methyl-accepting chemotaxis protein [Gallaecimonas mangrovi]|uniref:methyl-accepting chemotaxis protein n=1 Tax=Gallaecimonas mangrovi TaxID=2291597 RepID=UPI000E20BF16|nr:methyl-accepting chemotaxis protein [Gallaecimonas mangrovi]